MVIKDLKWSKLRRNKRRIIRQDIIILLTAISGLGILIGEIGFASASYQTCFTASCNETALKILEKINLSVDPCEDFYEFSCGNFIQNAKISKGRSDVSSFWLSLDQLLDDMRKLLEQPITKSEFKPFTLAKTYYQVCKNKTVANELTLPHFKRIFKEAGGWPVLEGDKWNETQFDWMASSQQLFKRGFNDGVFVEFQITLDVENSSLYILEIDQVSIEFEKIKRNGFNDSIVQAFYESAVKCLVASGAENETAVKEMKEVVELEIAIARILVPPEERRNMYEEINKMTFRELEQNVPFIPWLNYFNSLFAPDVNLTYDEKINVRVPKFYHRMNELLANTSKRTIANYMFWKIFSPFIKYMNDDLLNISLELDKVVSGTTENLPRWKTCLDNTKSFMEIATAALYLKHFYKPGTKESLLEIINAVREQFRENLETLDWMDDKTKLNAVEKLDVLSVIAAFPDQLEDSEIIDEYYKDFDFDSKDFLDVLLQVRIHLAKLDLEKYRNKIADKNDWRRRTSVVNINAYYAFQDNEIRIVAGILRDVFFDPNRPKYMNYGAIGTGIGHEITHGFDDSGNQYNKDGDLIYWWENTTKALFTEKTQCLIDQYGNITVPELNITLNGINTQGENIADNGGIKFAYRAYKKSVQEHELQQILPHLNYTPQQLFWISYGNMWCQKLTVEQLKLTVIEDKHPPHRYRINVPLMNSVNFAKDFGCAPGSNMNPVEKCSVW